MRFASSSVSFAGIAFATLSPAAAGQMVWTRVNTTAGPSSRVMHAMAYDSFRKRTVLFSGGVGSGNQIVPTTADTWEYDGKMWTQRSPLGGPSARVCHAMAYDNNRRVVVLFGGVDVRQVLSDTWEYDGVRWRRRTSSIAPPSLCGHSMAYDLHRRVMVVFGGWTNLSSSSVSNQTWEWDGTNWRRRVLISTPPARGHHGMVYDTARRVYVMFGGASHYGDHWEWDGTNRGWVRIHSGRRNRWNRIVYDEARQRTVRIGSVDATEEWDGRSWMTTAGPVLPRRAWHAVVYDSARSRVVQFGGAYSLIRPNDTWEYHPTVRGTATRVGAGCAGSAGIPTLTAVGPPIVGNQTFRLRIHSVVPLSPVFVALTTRPAQVALGGCTVFVDVWSSPPILVTGRSTLARTFELGLPIPFDQALSGFRLEAQGFSRDPGGTFFQSLAFTNGLRLVIGD